MSHPSRALGARLPRALRLALVIAVALCAAIAAAHPSIGQAETDNVSSLQVQGPNDRMATGQAYVSRGLRLKTDERTPACNGSGDDVRLHGANAESLLAHASHIDGDLRPLGISDQFDFGLLVCGVGPHLADGADGYWLYKVDHKAPPVGGDQYRLNQRDQVLWYYQKPSQNINTGQELVLRAPARARKGEEFTVTVFAFDDQGNRTRAANAQVITPTGVQVTNASGQVSLLADADGEPQIRATRGSDVPSNPQRVCINSKLSRCPSDRGWDISGTSEADDFKGTRGDDDIEARSGNDRINVVGGGTDRVNCGRGYDRVRADSHDRVSNSTCERITRD